MNDSSPVSTPHPAVGRFKPFDLNGLKTWKDLLDPKFRGKIASYDLRTPGPGQGSSAWIYNTFGIDYIKALFLDQPGPRRAAALGHGRVAGVRGGEQ